MAEKGTPRGRVALLSGILGALLLVAAIVAVLAVRDARRERTKARGAEPTLLPPRPPSIRSVLGVAPIRMIAADRSGVFAVAVSPEGDAIATGGADGALKVWAAGSGDVLATLGGYPGRVYSARFVGDGKRLLAAGGKRVDLWDLATRTATTTIDADKLAVSRAVPSPDGALVATSGAADHAIKLWDARSGKAARTLAPAPGDVALAIAFAPNGKTIAAAGQDPRVRVWSAGTGALAATCEGHTATVDDLAFTPDGQTLYSASDDHSVRAWTLACKPLATLGDHGDEVWTVAASPRGDLVASGTRDGWIKLWDTAKLALRYQLADESSHGVTALAFTPDGDRLVAAYASGAVRVWPIPGRTHAEVPPLPPLREVPDAGPSATPEQAYARASALIDAANGRDLLGEAERIARDLVAQHPRFAPGYVALSRVAFRRGYVSGTKFKPEAVNEAEQLDARALALDPKLPDAHVARAWILRARGDAVGASQEAMLAEAAAPIPSADALLARIEEGLGQLADAERHARRALQSRPTRGEAYAAYETLGAVYTDLGDYQAADQAYQRQIDVDPDAPWAKGNYAHFLIEIGEYPRAYDAAQRALAQSNYGSARDALSKAQSEAAILLLWDYGRLEDARKQLEGAIAAEATNAKAHYALGAYYRAVAITKKDAAALDKADDELKKAAEGGEALAANALKEQPAVRAWVAARR